MAYVDMNILTALLNRGVCQKLFGFSKACEKFKEEDEIAVKTLKGLEDEYTISRQAMLEDLPKITPEIRASTWSALTSMELKKVKFKDVDKSKALNKGFELLVEGCRVEPLTHEEKEFHFKYCGKPLWQVPDKFKKDLIHLGSAVLLGEKKFLTRDKELLTLGRFVRDKIKISDRV